MWRKIIMMKQSWLCMSFLMTVLLGVVLYSGTVFAGEGKAADMKTDSKNEALKSVVEKSIGKGVNILRIEDPEKSPINGLKQIRVWIEAAYGETPILYYETEDGKMYVAGSIFDVEGNNLTSMAVGRPKPRFIAESEMQLNDDYRIGQGNAKIRAVLWLGTDPLSKRIFETFYKIYEESKNSIAIYIKFYPRSERDFLKMSMMTCLKGDEAIDTYKLLLDTVPGWGSDEDLEVFKNKHVSKDAVCNKALIGNDIELSKKLKLPLNPVVLINGTMLLEELNKANISRLSGVELK
jgi:hypothetical protein